MTGERLTVEQLDQWEAAIVKATAFPYSVTETPWGTAFEPADDDPCSELTDHHLAADPAVVLAMLGALRAVLALADHWEALATGEADDDGHPANRVGDVYAEELRDAITADRGTRQADRGEA